MPREEVHSFLAAKSARETFINHRLSEGAGSILAEREAQAVIEDWPADWQHQTRVFCKMILESETLAGLDI